MYIYIYVVIHEYIHIRLMIVKLSLSLSCARARPLSLWTLNLGLSWVPGHPEGPKSSAAGCARLKSLSHTHKSLTLSLTHSLTHTRTHAHTHTRTYNCTPLTMVKVMSKRRTASCCSSSCECARTSLRFAMNVCRCFVHDSQ